MEVLACLREKLDIITIDQGMGSEIINDIFEGGLASDGFLTSEWLAETVMHVDLTLVLAVLIAFLDDLHQVLLLLLWQSLHIHWLFLLQFLQDLLEDLFVFGRVEDLHQRHVRWDLYFLILKDELLAGDLVILIL